MSSLFLRKMFIMEKFSFVFLIRKDTCWNQLFSHVDNLKKSSDEVGNYQRNYITPVGRGHNFIYV